MNRWTGDSGGAKAKKFVKAGPAKTVPFARSLYPVVKNFPGAGPVSKATKNFRLQQGGQRLYLCKFLFKFT